MLNKRYITAAAAGALIATSLGAAAFSFADTTPASTSTSSSTQSDHQGAPGVGGTVTAVSGNTITIQDRDGKTYTIEAGSAAITKDETVAVSDIAVGDTLMADGTVTGTSVTATSIHDGKMPHGGPEFGMGRGPMGDGVHGTVSAINGTTLTITETNPKDSTTSTYAVDATSAKVLKGSAGAKPTDSTLSAVAVGDEVMVIGAKSGTSVTATTIVDGVFPHGGMRGEKPAGVPTTSTTTQ